MVRSKQVKATPIMENGHIAQEQLEDVVSLALKVLKDLLLDTETSIETRFSIALRIFEMFGTDPSATSQKVALEEGIVRGVEKNAHDIERNAHRLSHIEALLQLATRPSNNEAIFQEETHSRKGPTIIDHV